MRKNLFLLPALLLVASALFVTSCGKDCEFNQADYTGQYSVDEDCSNSPAALYTVTIIAGSTETDVKLSNVWEFFSGAVNATIDCETITIARQEPDGDKYFIEGSGFIEKNDGKTTITLSYTVTKEVDPSAVETDNCTQTIYAKL
jgi:hypothetical protein